MDVFGNIKVEPVKTSKALSPIYQAAEEFSIYHEELDKEIGKVETAPYADILGEEFTSLELYQEILDKPNSEIHLAMEHAEKALENFYKKIYPDLSENYKHQVGLVEKAQKIKTGKTDNQKNAIYYF